MKEFNTYQHLAGEPMTARDETEVGSKFWNKGKWDNFVLPFLDRDCSEQTFVDIGCNAGLFLNLAEEKGFDRVIGIDSDGEAIERGREWSKRNGKSYQIWRSNMEDCIDDLPVADFVVLANVHYYFKIDDWLNFLDKLQCKTRYCIIVTTKKRPGNRCWAQADLENIDRYFKYWEPVGLIDNISTKDDPRPRKLYGLCFEGHRIDRVLIDSLDSGNHVQDKFYEELDSGKHYSKTKYYKIIEKYRLYDRKDWSREKLEKFFTERVDLYEDIKENGLMDPIIVDHNNLILDGNHRCQMLKHLGRKTVLVRKI